jgi:lipopolysaccharide transport system permease protein
MNSQPELIIEAGCTVRHYWADIWRYRELFFFLVWRDIIIRYKQTTVGIAWSVIRPLLTMLVFTFIFGRLANLPSDGLAYPVLVFSALLPWQLFANSLTTVGNSMVGNANLVTKVYFPRLILPLSALMVNLVDIMISFFILATLMLWYKVVPDIRIFALPLFLLLALLNSLGIGLWIASLNVRYRDFNFVVPFIVQAGLYISPVGFVSSIVPEEWRLIYSLNPMVGVIEGFRWSLLGSQTALYWPSIIMSVIVSFTVLLLGFLVFRKTERTFADII